MAILNHLDTSVSGALVHQSFDDEEGLLTASKSIKNQRLLRELLLWDA
jgi:hypothetical protein